MRLKHIISALMLCLISWISASATANYTSAVEATTGVCIVQMSELDLSKITYYNDNNKNAVRANSTTYGQGIVLKGVLYKSGVGTHAPSKAVIKLNGTTKFHAIFGVNDDADNLAMHGIVDYTVTLYKNKVATVVSSGTLQRSKDYVYVADLDVTGYDYLMLDYDIAEYNWADHCVWADARFEFSGDAPITVTESEMYQTSSLTYLPTVGSNGARIIPLSALELNKATCGYSTIKANKSIDGNTITVKGSQYSSGVGTHSPSRIVVKLNGAVTRFHTFVGHDDEVLKNIGNKTDQAKCDYQVILREQNGTETVVGSGSLDATDDMVWEYSVTCGTAKYLILDISNGADGTNGNDHVDWAHAYFEYLDQNSNPPEIVDESDLTSLLECSTVTFSQPNVRYMHKIVTGDKNASVTVNNLPEGLTWNAKRKLVEGKVAKEGTYTYNAVVTNSEGKTSEEGITLTVSSKLQQPTPMMGWLSWNVVQGEISNTVVETVADAMERQGLIEAGYNILAIDDLWHASSRASGTNKPVADSSKFPKGMKAASDYVHAKGMKFGIYSDAAEKTCANMFGSYGYEEIDAKQYAEWGVDMLKYDYCYAPTDQVTAQARYKTMGDALKNSGRDIIFYMCEWGTREPWKWGTTTGASCWRCTLDTRDGWNGKSNGVGMVESVAGMKDLWPYSGVNRFNDADMLCVGIHGKGKASSDLVVKAGMTQTEYRTQFAMWCMWSSPLFLSFDLRNTISDDDLAIITNSDLIAIDQDPMGQQAELISENSNNVQLYAKDLENGDVAVAVLNMSSSQQNYTIDFSKISALETGVTYYARDLQNRKDAGTVSNSISCTVASHGTVVYRLSKNQQTTGVDNLIKNDSDITVTTHSNEINVKLKGFNGISKRISVSDLSGQVIDSVITNDESATLQVKAAGLYIVHAISGGKTFAKKVKVGK